jgi:hypothetical protein
MSVGFSKRPQPSKLREHVLWTVRKTGQSAEARVGMTPFGPELRFLMWRGDKRAGDGNLLWSQVFRAQDGGGAALGEMAEQKRLKFLTLGWAADASPVAHDSTLAG